MGSVFFVCFFFLRADFSLWTLIGSRPGDAFFVVSSCLSRFNTMVNERRVLCHLAWLYELFVGMLQSLTHTPAAVDPHQSVLSALTWVREAEGF